jgi:hypothetical protein
MGQVIIVANYTDAALQVVIRIVGQSDLLLHTVQLCDDLADQLLTVCAVSVGVLQHDRQLSGVIDRLASQCGGQVERSRPTRQIYQVSLEDGAGEIQP